MFNIHGHVHNTTKESNPNSMNVCAENIGYKPISLPEFIKSGKLSKIDNLHRVTIDKATKRKNSIKLVG